MWVAGPRYRGPRGDTRKEGDPVPEAVGWKNIQLWERHKHVRWVPDNIVAKQRDEDSVPDPDPAVTVIESPKAPEDDHHNEFHAGSFIIEIPPESTFSACVDDPGMKASANAKSTITEFSEVPPAPKASEEPKVISTSPEASPKRKRGRPPKKKAAVAKKA